MANKDDYDCEHDLFESRLSVKFTGDAVDVEHHDAQLGLYRSTD